MWPLLRTRLGILITAIFTFQAFLAYAVMSWFAYILTSQGISERTSPLALATLVCTGAAGTLTVVGIIGGDLDPGVVTAEGWLWLAAIALVSTVAAIGMFFAGLRRVGPTAAAILSTLEPVVTIMLAAAAFSETLGPVQVTGGALVLAAALAVQIPARRLEPALA